MNIINIINSVSFYSLPLYKGIEKHLFNNLDVVTKDDYWIGILMRSAIEHVINTQSNSLESIFYTLEYYFTEIHHIDGLDDSFFINLKEQVPLVIEMVDIYITSEYREMKQMLQKENIDKGTYFHCEPVRSKYLTILSIYDRQ